MSPIPPSLVTIGICSRQAREQDFYHVKNNKRPIFTFTDPFKYPTPTPTINYDNDDDLY